MLDLGFTVLGSLELRDIAAPHLQRLAQNTGHTSNLAIRDDTDVILIDRMRGKPGRYHHLEFSLHVGSRIPSYCSATGKVLLAFLPQADLDDLLDRIELTPRGPRALTRRPALVAELAQVRRTGLAVNDEEMDSGLRAIAVPISPGRRGGRRDQPRLPGGPSAPWRADRSVRPPAVHHRAGDLITGHLIPR